MPRCFREATSEAHVGGDIRSDTPSSLGDSSPQRLGSSARLTVLEKFRALATENDSLRAKLARVSAHFCDQRHHGHDRPDEHQWHSLGDDAGRDTEESASQEAAAPSASTPRSAARSVTRLSRQVFASAPAPKIPNSEAEAIAELEATLAKGGIRLPRRADLLLQSQAVGRARRGDNGIKSVEDLRSEMMQEACRLDFISGVLVRRTDLVQAHLYVQVQGERRRLVQREEVGVQSGVCRVLMSPLMDSIRLEEDWAAALRRAFHAKAGLHPDQQSMMLSFDRSACKSSEFEQAAQEYGGLRTVGMLYQVVVTLHMQRDDKRVEGRLGLPNGSDFAVMERREGRPYQLHVWTWKSCEDERLALIEEFKEYLAARSVDVEKFGQGTMKSLNQFYTEVKENGESSLLEVPKADGEGTELLRSLALVEVRVLAHSQNKNLILKSTEQYLDDGRRRKVSQIVVHKLRGGESPEGAWRKALNERLALNSETIDTCFDEEEAREYKETKRWSSGYPLQTQYKVWTVTVNVRDADHPSLSDLGLPDGISFVSREGNLGKDRRGRLHVWTWEKLPGEEADSAEQVGTGLEELCAGLKEAETLALQTSREAAAMSVGLDAPLHRIVAAVRRARAQMANVDTACSEVDLTGLAGLARKERSHSKATAAQGLIDFVSATFTQNRGRQSGPPRAEISRTTSTDIDMMLGGGSPQDSGGRDDLFASIRTGISNWHYDIFSLHEESQDCALQLYGEVTLGPLCRNTFAVGQGVARAFLERVALDYYGNPYHNAIHATQVAHLSNWLLKSLEVQKNMRGIERAGSIIAALCHDMKHFGRNNAFCIASSHPLALLYNDQAVLENMHSAACFAALREGDSSELLLKNLKQEDSFSMRSFIVKLILSTDMSEHFQAISKFRVKLGAEGVSYDKSEDRLLVATMCIKAADIGHSALEWSLHTQWSERVAREFFEQGDDERSMGLPISALCDRQKMGDLGKAQKGFLEFVCLPLFQEFGALELSFEMANVPEVASDEHHEGVDEHRMSKSSLGSSSRRSARYATVAWDSLPINPVKRVCIETLKDNASRWDEDRASVEAMALRLSETGRVA